MSTTPGTDLLVRRVHVVPFSKLKSSHNKRDVCVGVFRQKDKNGHRTVRLRRCTRIRQGTSYLVCLEKCGFQEKCEKLYNCPLWRECDGATATASQPAACCTAGRRECRVEGGTNMIMINGNVLSLQRAA